MTRAEYDEGFAMLGRAYPWLRQWAVEQMEIEDARLRDAVDVHQVYRFQGRAGFARELAKKLENPAK